MSTHTRWYIRRGEQIKGPYQEKVVKQSLLLGRIRDTDEASEDKLSWRPISSCKFLYPDVLANENTAEHEIREARIKADERVRDRRGEAKSKMDAERRKARDRRGEEDEDMVEYRERHARVMDSLRHKNETQKSKRGFIYLSVVSLFLIGTGYIYTPSGDEDKPDCDAKVAPGVNWSNCPMHGLNAANSDLQNAKLKSTKLDMANLLGVNLSGANLAYAELPFAVLSNTELRGANFKGANLSNADLSYANLNHADLSFADLSNANIGGADFTNTKLDNTIWIDAQVCAPGSVGKCLKN